MSLEESLGRRIRQLREQRGWTQEKLADEAGLASRHIQQLEHGERWPRADTLRRLAEAFGIEAEEILRGI